MKFAAYAAAFLIVCWSLATVAQLWWGLLSSETYWKLTLTVVVLGGGIVLASLIVREYLRDERMKKDKYLD